MNPRATRSPPSSVRSVSNEKKDVELFRNRAKWGTMCTWRVHHKVKGFNQTIWSCSCPLNKWNKNISTVKFYHNILASCIYFHSFFPTQCITTWIISLIILTCRRAKDGSWWRKFWNQLHWRCSPAIDVRCDVPCALLHLHPWAEVETSRGSLRWMTVTLRTVVHFNTTTCLDLWWGLVSAGPRACCFQILNNSAISYCSPQLFLPCDPQSRKQQRIHVCTRGDSADSYVLSYIPSNMLWNSLGFPFVHLSLSLLSVFLSWLVFTPSRSLHWGDSGWTL